MIRALPLVPGRSGVFQSRSVGPLPATKTIAGNGPAPDGRTTVPRMVIESICHSTSVLLLIRHSRFQFSEFTRAATHSPSERPLRLPDMKWIPAYSRDIPASMAASKIRLKDRGACPPVAPDTERLDDGAELAAGNR